MFDFIKLRLGLWKKSQSQAPKQVVTVPVQAEHLLINLPTGRLSDVDLSPRTPNEYNLEKENVMPNKIADVKQEK